MKKWLFLCAILFIMSACSTKTTEDLYNLSAIEWYQQIIKDLQDQELEKADTHYNSMASEHISDPLLEQILLILAQAHMDEEEYVLAEFYLDEYSKKFGNSKNAEYIRYLKIKAKFSSFSQPNRNQALMIQSSKEIEEFLQNYPDTQYKLLVQTMLTKFNLANYYLDETIADLYKRTDRMQSYEIYQEKLKNSDFYDTNMITPERPWYRKVFE